MHNGELNDWTLTEEEQEQYFPLNPEVKKQWQTWVPEGQYISNMQIYDAIERGIPCPNGDPVHDQEYIQFLNEHTLHPEKKETIIKVPPVIPVPEPTPVKKERISLWNRLFKKQQKEVENVVENLDNSAELKPQDVIEPQVFSDLPITEEEIIKATNSELQEQNNDVVVKVVKRRKSFLYPLLIAAIGSMLASGIKVSEEPAIVENAIHYVVDQNMSVEDAMKKAIGDVKLHDENYLSSGTELTTHSKMVHDESYPGVTKTLGDEFNKENKHPGNYPITGFSVLRKSDNSILGAVEDFYTPSDVTKLSEFVDKTLEGTNLSYEDINIAFHYGRTNEITGEKSRLGWKDSEVLSAENINKIMNEAATYEGKIENFSGDTISISTKDGNVVIPVKDANGNYFKSGDIVKGSDGKEYQISSLDVEEMVQSAEESSKKSVSFAFKDCSILASIPFLAAALADFMIKKKQDKKAEQNPSYKMVEGDNLENYIDEFRNNKRPPMTYHKAIIYTPEQLNPVIIQAYKDLTGITLNSVNEINYFIHNDKFLITDREDPSITYDITEYIKTLDNGKDIGIGYDPEVEENKGR